MKHAMKYVVALVLSAAACLVWIPPAAACSEGCGEPAMSWDQPYYKPGEIARGVTFVSWPAQTQAPRRNWLGAGRPENGPYFLYLRPARSDIRVGPAEDAAAIALGAEMTIVTQGRGKHGRAEVEFTVPEVPGGDYLVDHCNSGCTHRLGYLSTAVVTIVATEAEERNMLESRFGELQNQIYGQSSRLARFQYRTRKVLKATELELTNAEASIALAEETLDDYKGRIAALRAVIEAQRRAPVESRDPALSTFLVSGALTAAAALLLRRRKDLLGLEEI